MSLCWRTRLHQQNKLYISGGINDQAYTGPAIIPSSTVEASASTMAGLPYAVPPNYVIRLVEETLSNAPTENGHPIQPHAHPSHFQFPRTSLHAATLHSHFNGPHARGSVRAPKSTTSWSPATDIRETLAAYHIEVEVPGVANKDDILIQWLSPHTLLVQGVAGRPKNIGLTDQGEGKKIWEGNDDDGWATEAHGGKVRSPPRWGSLP